MVKNLYLILFLFLQYFSFSQNIDSLHLVIKKTSKDSIKASSLNKISSYYNNRNQLDSAIKYLDKSLKISLSNNFEEITFYNKEVLSIVFAKKSEYHSADSLLQHLEKEIMVSKISDSAKEPHLLSVYITLGIVNTINNYNSKALEFYLKGVNKAKKLDKKSALATLYNNIGNIYISEEDDSLAREYLVKAKDIYKKTKDNKGLTKVYLNLGNIHRYHKEFQQAINNYEESQEFSLLNSDSISYANAEGKIGLTYLEIYKSTDQIKNFSNELSLLSKESILDKALDKYLNSNQILSKFNVPLYTSNNKIAEIYLLKGDLNPAISIYKNNFNNLDLYSINNKIEAANGLKKSYKQLGNSKLALKWNEELSLLNDTLKARENFKEFGKKQAELEFIKTQEIEDLKYKTEVDQINRENEKKQLIAKNNQRKQLYIIWSVVVSIFLVGFFLIVIIRRWRLTKKQKETIDKQKQVIEKEKQATEDSINYARNIQKAAFPSLIEVNKIIPNNFILFKPKDIVSGDFYWVSKLKDKKIIALGDCTGHGVPGAFMTLISLNILNQIIAEGIDNLLTILEQLHLRLQKRLNIEDGNSSKHGLDLAICMLEEGKLIYAGTHIPLYHIRNGSLTEYKGQNFQLGSNDSTMFQQHEILLQKNDSFYLSTDGFPDQKGGAKGKKYYYPTLRNKLTSLVNLELIDQRKDLNNEFINWKGEQEQLDDVSLIGFKI